MSKSSNTFLVSDETINTYGCRVLSKGGDTTAFESNPVMFFMHQRGNVIGRWDNLRLEEGKWYADAVFDTQDEGLGKEVAGKVTRGFLKAASIGINIIEAVFNDLLNCYDIIKWSFQEISIVDIGSNANALQLYDKAGEPITELKLAAHLEQFKPTQPTTNDQTISTKPMELKTMAIALGLPETATEQEVLTLAAQNHTAVTELAQLKVKLAADQVAEATTLVDQAIADKRIPATTKEVYLKLFAADHESTKAILAGLAKPANLVQFASQGAAEGAALSNLDSDAKAKKYDELDMAGTLMKLAQTNPVVFSDLYEAKYGSKPTKITV